MEKFSQLVIATDYYCIGTAVTDDFDCAPVVDVLW